MSFVFISHSNDEDHLTDRVSEGLKAEGIETWADHIHGFGSFEERQKLIDIALRNATTGLLVLSERSCGSKDCYEECCVILEQHKPLHILLIEPVKREDLPERLQQLDVVDGTNNFDNALKKIASSIRAESAYH